MDECGGAIKTRHMFIHCSKIHIPALQDNSKSFERTKIVSEKRYWLARLLSFKQPLLSVDLSVCMCVGNFDAISETKRFRGSCPIGIYRKVPTACRLVTSSMT